MKFKCTLSYVIRATKDTRDNIYLITIINVIYLIITYARLLDIFVQYKDNWCQDKRRSPKHRSGQTQECNINLIKYFYAD